VFFFVKFTFTFCKNSSLIVEVNFIFGQPKQLQLGSSKPGQKLKKQSVKKSSKCGLFQLRDVIVLKAMYVALKETI